MGVVVTNNVNDVYKDLQQVLDAFFSSIPIRPFLIKEKESFPCSG